MNSKKKMIIAISAFAMVILAAVVAVVAVLAAQTVTVRSSITITYSVEDVVAEVQVYAAAVDNGGEITWGSAKTAKFDVNGYKEGTESSGSGGAAEISLNSFELEKNQCVVLKFVFNNDSEKAFTATLANIETAGKNVNIYYATSDTNLSSLTSGSNTAVSVDGGADKTAFYYVRIAIAETAKGVNFQPEFKWTLAAK